MPRDEEEAPWTSSEQATAVSGGALKEVDPAALHSSAAL